MKKFFSKSIKAVVLALIFGAVTVFAAPFQGPSFTPAQNNAPAPVNVSTDAQIKGGPLAVSGLLVGPGSPIPTNVPTTSAKIWGALAVGSATPVGAPAGTVVSSGLMLSGTDVVGSKNVFAGGTSWVNQYQGAGNTGAVSADRFCFSSANGGCITNWAGVSGSGSLTGATNETIRFSAPNTPVTTNALTNDGNVVVVGGSQTQISTPRLTVKNGPLLVDLNNALGTNNNEALILKSGGTNTAVRITAENKNYFEFWTKMSNTLASVIVEGLKINVFSSVTSSRALCVQPGGNVVLCGGNPTAINGNTDEVPRFSAPFQLDGSSNLKNNGVTVKIGESQPVTANRLDVFGGAVQINNAPLKVNLTGSAPGGTDAIILNTSSASPHSSIVTNRSGLTFWSTESGGHFASISVNDIYSGGTISAPVISGTQLRSATLANTSQKQICADGIGALIFCPTSTGGTNADFSVVGSHSWTVPAGVNSIRIQIWGGGGGGSGGNPQTGWLSGGNGGGGGAYIDVSNVTVVAGQTYSLSVGNGGSGGSRNGTSNGNPGNDGQSSNFVGANTYTAGGGKGAPTRTSTSTVGGLGGTGTAPGGIVSSGNNGAIGNSFGTPYDGGAGGYAGAGSGYAYGKGGDGGRGFTTQDGQSGSAGRIIITY